MKKATKDDINIIKEAFIEHYSDAVTELNYKNDYELLIAIILSAQCTDKRVNIITPALFEKYPTVFDLSCANLDDVKKLINSCSFFNNKAHKAGLNVNALIAEITIAIASVKPNCL